MRPHAVATALVLAHAVAAPTVSAGGARMLRCQARIVAASDALLARRRDALARCLEKAWRCPAALGAGSAADPCLAAVAVRCRARLARVRPSAVAVETAGPRCVAPAPAGIGVAAAAFFDPDAGLGFAAVPAFCPDMAVQPAVAADASRCQERALVCSEDAAFTAAAPRAAALLARLGLPLDTAPGCLGARLCGNGRLDGDEECDDGAANSDTRPNACRTTCVAATCGDGVVDDGEECDDGNDVDGDGCESDCTRTAGPCGDGVVDDGEECDDGNQVNGDGCENDCTLTQPVCGDGIVSRGEQCDDGNTVDGDGCDSNCTISPGVCGNGVVDPGEECDDGLLNSDVLPDRCRTDCTRPSCGDGVVDPGHGEQCDPPGTLLCDARCMLRLPPPLHDSPPAPVRAEATDGVAACQRSILRGGSGLFVRTRMRVEGCVAGLARCAVGLPDGPAQDGCLRRAAGRCRPAVTARAALRARAVADGAARCAREVPPAGPSFDRLLDPATGLGFATAAARCALPGDGSPRLADLLDCAYRDVQCSAEAAVARTIPRAWGLLDDAGLGPADRFPCVTDPDGP